MSKSTSNGVRNGSNSHTGKALARNTIYSGISNLSDVFLLVLFVAAARFLGADNFGVFAFSLAISSLLVFITNLGLDLLAIRYIAIDKSKAPHIIGSILVWKLVVSVLFVACFVILIKYLINDAVIIKLCNVLAIAALLRSFNISFRSYLQAFNKFRLESIIVFYERISLLLFGLIILQWSQDPMLLAWTLFLVRASSALIYIIVLQKYVCKFTLVLDVGFIKKFQMEAFPLGINNLIQGAFTQIDTITIGFFRPPADVGLFSSVQKLYEGSLVSTMIINAVIYPQLSAYYVHNKQKHQELFLRGFKYLMLMAVPIAAIGILFPKEIIVFLFGSDYIAASLTLTILMIAVAFQFLVTSVYTVLRSMGQQKNIMNVSIFGLVFKIPANLILIPLYGIEGSAAAVLFSSMLMLFFSLFYIKKQKYSIIRLMHPATKIIIAAMICSIIVFLLPIDSFLIQLLLFAIVYVSMLFILAIFDKKEIKIISNLLLILTRRRATWDVNLPNNKKIEGSIDSPNK